MPAPFSGSGFGELEVSCAETLARHASGQIQLVDVRESYEYDAGRVAGAHHVGMGDLAAKAGELDASRPIVFYCRVGARSAMAAQAFRRAGYDAWSMAGGLEAWAAEGHALEPEDGTVAAH
jgi:hydroxyacylglutathione hydrolase/adenylyltransferase/sulfurtransferase